MAEVHPVICKLNGVNYASWSFQMKLLMMEKDLWTTVDPGETKPNVEDVEATKIYMTRQGKAFAKICLNIEKEQQQHIQHLSCPKTVWLELQKLYAPKDSKFRIVQLRRQLYCEKLTDHDNMDSYLGKINHIVTELTNVGDKIDDSDLAMMILCGLSEEWDNVISAICNLPEDEFNCTNVKRRLIAESERRNSSISKNGGAMLAEGVNRSHHEENRNIPKGGTIKKNNVVCYRCGKKNHYAKECRTKINKPCKRGPTLSNSTNSVNVVRNNNNRALNMSAVFSAHSVTDYDKWIIDSGATHHMTPKKEYFSSLVKHSDEIGHITVADGSTISTGGIGTACVNIINTQGPAAYFEARNTLFVPGIKHGVLSVKQIVENGKQVIFDQEGCHILDSNGKLIIEAESKDRLFLLSTSAHAKQNVFSARGENDTELPLEIWHQRLMHVNYQEILKMSKSETVKGLRCQGAIPEKCDSCLQGKSARQSFPKRANKDFVKEKRPLGLVHADLMGPINPLSWGGAKYILCIIDEATRYASVFPLWKKGDVLGKFKEWKIMAENQTGNRLEKIRTDNGLEFCSEAFEIFCKAHGILHQKTMIYTPEQNGLAERLNRTLLDLVRSTLCSSGLPKASWAELTCTAAYIRNRVTNKHNEMITPHELWFGRKPSLRHLRICGSEVFVHIPRQKRNCKLSVRAQRGRLVGYAVQGHGWRVWIPDSQRVIESRDCVFKENVKESIQENENTLSHPYSSEDEEEEENFTQTENVIQCRESVRIRNENQVEDSSNTRNKTQSMKCHPMTLRNQKVEENPNSSLNECIRATSVNDHNPSTYSEAINSPDASKWLEAVEEEMESLRSHNVWELSELPEGNTPVQCKWVFTKKRNAEGKVERYKARLVAKGFTQQKGVDYDEVYAPVSSFETIRLLTAVGVEEGWILDQYDVKSAYLYGTLKETIYMEQPEGLMKQKNLYCKLKKSIYGLKQSGRCWNEYLDKWLKEAGFKRNSVDPCIYMLEGKEGKSILSIYVDDIFCMSENEVMKKKSQQILCQQFESKYLGPVNYLLGVKFFRNDDNSISLTQEAYVNRLIEKFNLKDAKEAVTPMENKSNFTDESQTSESLPYRELIGGLLYLSQRTRPDISYSVGRLAQFCSNYTREHWEAAKRVLRYVKGTTNYGITYRKCGETLIAYSDADWATNSDDRKSTTGYVVMLGGAPILWRSAKQTSTALSTMEAEYVAVSDCVREVTWIQQLLEQLGLKQLVRKPTRVMCDSQSAIAHAMNYVDRSRTKHISIRHYFVREKIQDRTVQLVYVPSEQNTADVLTKPLSRCLHEFHRNKLVNMRSDTCAGDFIEIVKNTPIEKKAPIRKKT